MKTTGRQSFSSGSRGNMTTTPLRFFLWLWSTTCLWTMTMASTTSATSTMTSRFAISVAQRLTNPSSSWRMSRGCATKSEASMTLTTSMTTDDHMIHHHNLQAPQQPRLIWQHNRGGGRQQQATTKSNDNIKSSRSNQEPVKTMTAWQMQAFSLLSGGMAGTVASTITNPLEVIKTQLQSSNKLVVEQGRNRVVAVAQVILQADGFPGFFRGLPATLAGIIPSRSVYFYAYQRSKNFLSQFPGFEKGSPPNALLAGFSAGIAGNTITNPIWMVRTRMQLLADASAGQVAYRGYFDAITTIFREEGLKGFYKGVAASYWGCTEGAAQFLMYEQLKSRLLTKCNQRRAASGLPPTDHLSEWTLFLSAAASKMIASIATYPHEVARTRMREQAKMGVFKYKGMWQTLSVIAREEGRGGMYSGMGVHLLKVVPNSAIMFLTYELVRKWLKEFQVVDK